MKKKYILFLILIIAVLLILGLYLFSNNDRLGFKIDRCVSDECQGNGNFNIDSIGNSINYTNSTVLFKIRSNSGIEIYDDIVECGDYRFVCNRWTESFAKSRGLNIDNLKVLNEDQIGFYTQWGLSSFFISPDHNLINFRTFIKNKNGSEKTTILDPETNGTVRGDFVYRILYLNNWSTSDVRTSKDTFRWITNDIIYSDKGDAPLFNFPSGEKITVLKDFYYQGYCIYNETTIGAFSTIASEFIPNNFKFTLISGNKVYPNILNVKNTGGPIVSSCAFDRSGKKILIVSRDGTLKWLISY